MQDGFFSPPRLANKSLLWITGASVKRPRPAIGTCRSWLALGYLPAVAIPRPYHPRRRAQRSAPCWDMHVSTEDIM